MDSSMILGRRKKRRYRCLSKRTYIYISGLGCRGRGVVLIISLPDVVSRGLFVWCEPKAYTRTTCCHQCTGRFSTHAKFVDQRRYVVIILKHTYIVLRIFFGSYTRLIPMFGLLLAFGLAPSHQPGVTQGPVRGALPPFNTTFSLYSQDSSIFGLLENPL